MLNFLIMKYYLRKALIKSKYPKWVLDKVERKFTNRSQEDSNVGNNLGEVSEEDSNNPSSTTAGRDTTKKKDNKGHIVIPYTQGLGESIKNICRKYGICTHFKGNRTIRNILVKPKDKDPLVRKSGAIYWYQCGELMCDMEYIGKTSRTFWEKIQRAPERTLTIYGHSNESGHSTNPDNFTIIGRERHSLARIIKESIYIRVYNPTFNRNVGKYNHHIWDRVLFNTPELKINNDNRHAHRTSFSEHSQSIPTNRHVHRTIRHTGCAQMSEHVHRTSQNQYKVQYITFSLTTDEVQ